MDDKKGINLIIDRVEALRVRIDSYDIKYERSEVNKGVLKHWSNLCIEAKTEAVKMQHALDVITANLALPRDESPENIALAVRACVRRCEELEHKLLAFQDSHT